MSLFRGLVPELIPYAEYLYKAAMVAGLHPRITSVRRTAQQQAVLYERYLQGRALFPALPPGRSKHQYGLAFDLVCDDAAALGGLWRQMGGRWFASDAVHFEV